MNSVLFFYIPMTNFNEGSLKTVFVSLMFSGQKSEKQISSCSMNYKCLWNKEPS